MKAIPITTGAWHRTLIDLRLAERLSSALSHLRPTNDPVPLSELVELADFLEVGTMFEPPRPAKPRPSTLQRLAAECRSATGRDPEGLRSLGAVLAKVRDQIARELLRDAHDEDPFRTLLGVDREGLLDARGVVRGDRLSAAFAIEKEPLARISRKLAKAIGGSTALSSRDVALIPTSVAIAAHPAVWAEVARFAFETIRRARQRDASQAAAVVVQLLERIPEAASSHFDGAVAATRRMGATGTPSEQATLCLERYRHIVEGQLRHTAWALLQLMDGGPIKPPPTLGSIRRQLSAVATWSTSVAATAIREEWRNAAAHDDVYWDSELGLLRLRQEPVATSDLEHMTSLALDVISGFEVAVSMGRATFPDLADAIDRRAPTPGRDLLDLGVRRIFARYGVFTWDIVWTKNAIELITDEPVRQGSVPKLLTGVLHGAAELGLRRNWRISGRGQGAAIAISSDAIEMSISLLRGRPRAVPLDVILPMVGAAKLASGDSTQAASDHVTKLALQQPLHTGQQFMPDILQRKLGGARRLRQQLGFAGRVIDASRVVLSDVPAPDPAPMLLNEAERCLKMWISTGSQYSDLARAMNALLDLDGALARQPLLASLPE